MNDSLKINGLTYQVRASDFEAGEEWYSKLLGRAPDFLPHEGFQDQIGFCEWELMPGSGCWLQVAEGPPTVGSGPIRFGVENIEAVLDRLDSVIDLDRPKIVTTPDGKVRHCTFEDPFGNRIGFYDEL